VNTETIYAALFALAAATPGIQTSSRKLALPDDVNGPDCPALFMTQGDQEAFPLERGPTKWVLQADLYLYFHQSDIPTDGVFQMAINSQLDALRVQLDPPPGLEEQTLGGLVTRCRLKGKIQVYDGSLSERALAIAPVEIIANA